MSISAADRITLENQFALNLIALIHFVRATPHIKTLHRFNFSLKNKLSVWEYLFVFMRLTCTSSVNLPVIVSIAERSDRDGEGLPHRVQCVLHHLGLVADSEPGDAVKTNISKI